VLTSDEIRRFLNRVSYKPGWEFSVTSTPFEGERLRIVAPGLPDSYEDGRTIDLGVDSYLPWLENTDELARWLFSRVKRIEIHEAMEFFKVDGRIVWDPHAEQSRGTHVA
jgi:hypothetical protein